MINAQNTKCKCIFDKSSGGNLFNCSPAHLKDWNSVSEQKDKCKFKSEDNRIQMLQKRKSIYGIFGNNCEEEKYEDDVIAILMGMIMMTDDDDDDVS